MPEGNPLVAAAQSDTTAVTGIGIAESSVGLANGISNGDWVEAGLGAVGVGLEVMSMVIDPIGTIASYGVSWLIEHVQPLKEALDWFAGDPPVIRSFSETWGNVAAEVNKVAADYNNEVKNGTAGWTGQSADTYRGKSAETADAVAGAGALADGISAGVMIMGEVVAAVRELVRDLVAEVVGKLITWALEAVATLGLGTPVIVAQATAAISKVVNKIADLVRKLVKTIGNVTPRIRKIIDKLDEIIAKLGKLGRKADGTSPSSATTPDGFRSPDTTSPSGTTSPSSSTTPDTTSPTSPSTSPSSTSPDTTSPSGGDVPGGNGKPPTKADNQPTRDTDGGGGQKSEGNGGCDGKGGDPVDVVSGQMITSTTDLALAGLLPLVVRRAYASDFRDGRLFGPGWSSTLDQRLEVDGDGVTYIGDDAQVLRYLRRSAEPVMPVHGARWPLTWDQATDTYRIEDPESGWVRHFTSGQDASVKLIGALTDRDGHRVDYIRDPAGLPMAIRHSGGYYVAVDVLEGMSGARIGSLRLIDQEAQGVTVVSYRYDTLGRLTGIVNSSGLPYRYEYDTADRITAWVDRNGFSYRYYYGPDGRVVRGESDGGHLNAHFDYDLVNRVTTVVNSLGHATRWHYDQHNHISKVVDPLGNEQLTEYDRYHRLLSTTDALGNTTRYVRDEQGNAIRIEYADGTHVDAAYDERWQMPTRLAKPGGVVWQHTYSETGNVVSTTDPMGATTTSELDARGHLVAKIGPDGQRWTFTSDDTGRPLSATTPFGATTRYSMDGFGRLVATTGPQGAVTRYGWTVDGRLAWQASPDGARQELSYDPQGNLVRSRDAVGGTTTFEVGPFNLPVARTGPDGTRYTFAYDTELRLVRVTNPLGLTWDYGYDPAGNLVRESDFTGRTVTYRYDATGQLASRHEQSGAGLDLTRDVRGRVVTQQVAGEQPVRFEFDDAGRLSRASNGVTEVAYERDLLGRPIVESIDGRAVRSEYDLLGRRIRRTTPSGVETRWQHTPMRQASALTGTAGELSFEYDPAGREITRRLGRRAALTQSYDEASRLTGQNLWAHPSTDPNAPDVPANRYLAVQQRSYRYRADGAVTAVGDRLRGDRAYELTPAGRVTAVTGATWAERYTYDALGNLTTAQPGSPSDTAGPQVVDGVLLRGAGRSSYEYDDNGRLIRQIRHTLSGRRRIWAYRWNGNNQLVGVSTPDGALWQYTYDPFGRRTAKRRVDENGAVLDETTFSWDGSELAEQLHTSAGRVTATSWDYRAATSEPLAQTARSWLADAPGEVIDTRFHAIVSDLVGTPTELVGPDGRVSWYRTANLWGDGPVGGVSSTDGTDCPLRFPGQYHDPETGLHYNFHRYYDPATARYLSPDPVGLSPSSNHYTYVVNPLTICDPFGLSGHRGPDGRYAVDPSVPRTEHNRSSEYPHTYWDSTHEEMARRFTVEGQALGGQTPVDAHGVPIPRDQLNWVDATGQPIPFEDLTYDHNPAVVQHWIDEGYDQTRAQREAWYNQTDDMEAMTRAENGRRGAMLEERYSDREPGPNYSCS